MEAPKRVQPKRLVVGKGKTSRPSDAEEWNKEYYQVEAVIEEPSELEVAKANLTGLIHKDISEFTRDALREKIQRDAPSLYQKQFQKEPEKP